MTMASTSQNPMGILQMPEADCKLKAIFTQLSRAQRYGHDAHCDPWEFALEIQSLTIDGVTTNDLRWLVKQGCVAHACEITRRNDLSRKFQPCRNPSFS